MRIKEYTKATQLAATDSFVVETANGTRQIEVRDMGFFNSSVAGAMPISQGGTGMTTNPSMVVNLGTTAAANVFQTTPRPGITGTLGVANGGTGLTAPPSLLINLASTSAVNPLQAAPRPGVTGTLPVARGGTGVTTTAAIGLLAYPVGSVYIAYNSTSPASRFGGTWTQITGRVLRAANDVNTGGSDSVTLTTAQMPSHYHPFNLAVTTDGNNNVTSNTTRSVRTVEALQRDYKNTGGYYVSTATNYTAYKGWYKFAGYMANTGSGSSFSNLPAYQDLYVWRRTA